MTDLGEQLARRLLEIDYDTFAPFLMPDGSAPQRQWSCEDGWIVVYTTGRIDRGRWAGKFVTMLYKPVGKGARTNQATRWERVYARPFASRSAAKARALALYGQHSPNWDGARRAVPQDPEI